MSYQEESLAPPPTLYAPAREEPAYRPSAEQEAIRARGHASNVLVAAAGSGKTRVLTWLYADAHLEHGIPIDALLAITFTDKAAGELRHRIGVDLAKASLTGTVDLGEAWIGTFHGICARILREFAHRRGLDPAFGVIEELQSLELQAQAWDEAVEGLLRAHGGDAASLIAQVGDRMLRAAIIEWWTARRSSGEVHPELPTPQTTAADVEAAADAYLRACEHYSEVLDDLQSQRSNPLKSLTDRLEIASAMATTAARVSEAARSTELTPGAVAELSAAVEAEKPKAGVPVPRAEHNALLAARDAVVRRLAEHVAGPRVRLLGDLVRRFSHAYEDAKRHNELLDFDDLELEALQLLREDDDVRLRLVERFERILVDEFQDTNPRQAELVDLLAGGPTWIPVGGDGRPAVTVVGDPRQAIYGFRHADVELIGGAAERIADEGSMRLSTNYRSDAEVLSAIDEAFGTLDPDHEPVTAFRGPDRLASGEARVELLITKEEPGGKDAPLPSWSEVDLGGTVGEKSGAALAEARLVAARIDELRRAEPDRSITVLGRARSVLAPIAEALGDLGIPASIDGAEGFWERLEVIDVLAWIRLVRNPADDAALIMVCASPLLGLSADGLAQLGLLDAERRHGGRIEALRACIDRFDDVDTPRLAGLFALLDRQREPGRAADPAGLIDELLLATGYDEHVLRLVGGDRRAANVVRLRRLASEIAARGGDLTDLVERAEKEVGHELRAPEASVAGAGAVTLMTVHQSKGLEFDTVVVVGLGSRQRLSSPALIGAPRSGDARLGLRLRPSPGAPAQSLFDHDDLVAELRAREDEELRRVLYVALTRARERLIVSGLARWTQKGSPFTTEPSTSAPVLTWLAPAMVPELDSVIEAASVAPLRTSGGITLRVSTPDGDTLPPRLRAPERPELPVHQGEGPCVASLPPAGSPPLQAPRVLSYTALKGHARCGLRFYAERVLGVSTPEDSGSGSQAASIPPVAVRSSAPLGQAVPSDQAREPTAASPLSYASAKAPSEQLDLFSTLAEPALPTDSDASAPAPGRPVDPPDLLEVASDVADVTDHADRSPIAANELGSAVHVVLERVSPQIDAAGLRDAVEAATVGAAWSAHPDARDEVRSLVEQTLRAPVLAELWADGKPSREVSFTLAVGDAGLMITGDLDAWRVNASGEALVVDYKTDHVSPGEDLTARTADDYGLQQRIYALAALRAGARSVRVVHLYVRAAEGTVEATWDASQAPALEAELAAAAAAVDRGDAVPQVTVAPQRFTCDRCPVGGTLCGWPVELTKRAPGSGPAPSSQWRGDPAVLPAAAGGAFSLR